ncbi:hypothetical protein DM02DRAFT_244621 [Periconia macrospinosa]|uniref:Uncharacterized protein n=1 Tax=Periconia macrospinosa TaxID=97972 RepID=A0A2V1DYR5_9PLEO|nr:hypothetical protein DM02DRAFT_244621 [Periconia macrospinosa]
MIETLQRDIWSIFTERPIKLLALSILLYTVQFTCFDLPGVIRCCSPAVREKNRLTATASFIALSHPTWYLHPIRESGMLTVRNKFNASASTPTVPILHKRWRLDIQFQKAWRRVAIRVASYKVVLLHEACCRTSSAPGIAMPSRFPSNHNHDQTIERIMGGCILVRPVATLTLVEPSNVWYRQMIFCIRLLHGSCFGCIA